jgi:hypothetical protein
VGYHCCLNMQTESKAHVLISNADGKNSEHCKICIPYHSSIPAVKGVIRRGGRLSRTFLYFSPGYFYRTWNSSI